jgi:sugar O-acyltransferase (sialic acid O-acetyltransferase NeuD family)
MRDLVIIGAGNVGGFLAYNQNLFTEPFNIIGFLDDDVAKHGKEFYGLKVLGNTGHLFTLGKNTAVAIGIGFPKAKRKVFEKIRDNGNDFPSFISEKAWVSNNVSVGKGVILYPGVSINYQTAIDDFVIMNMNCAVGHDCSIGKFCALAPGVNLGGFTVLEEAVDMGIGSATKQNIIVGKDAVIGGQAMLVKNVEPGTKVAGVPGRAM